MEDADNFFNSLMDVLHEIETYHDSHTIQHEYRTGKLMAILAQIIGLDADYCKALKATGSLHDIGKVALPRQIIDKAGALSSLERKTVEMHPQIGYELIKKIKHPFVEIAAVIVLNHHESYDGSGYPNGLKGKNIPLEGRICRICDVYDALRSRRPYQKTNGSDPHETSIQIITDNNMVNCFDPVLLEVFRNNQDKYEHLYKNI